MKSLTFLLNYLGLDYHYTKSPQEVQKRVFARQLDVACGLGKPLVIHTRDAENDTLEILKDHVLDKTTPIHVHCFTSSKKLATDLLKTFSNLYLGFTGIVTFSSAKELHELVKEVIVVPMNANEAQVPLNKILLETDGPFLAPVPFRGKIAHSGMIPYIAECIAKLKKVPVEQLYEQVRKNTEVVYGI